MNIRYCFELQDSPYLDPCFAYFDTPDHLAEFLFDHEHVDVAVEGEYSLRETDPYRIIICRIPKGQRDEFLKCIGLLPAFMSYAGHDDYESYCRSVTSDFLLRSGRGTSGRSIPIQ